MALQTQQNVIINQPKVVAVEGKNDKMFFDSLIQHLGLTQIQVVCMFGRFPLSNKIASVKNIRGFKKLVTSFLI